jgi:4-amino-4-deoxy-L-arabinose transferase-like glycosyltransferase
VIGWILLGMAFLLRLLWGLWAVGQPAAAVLGDSFWYHETAVRIALGRGYLNPFTELPTAAWPPGYPAALALLYAVAGVDRRLGILLNAAAGTVTCFCCWRLARALAGERAGLAALALLAFFPSHVFFTSLLLSETLFAAALAMLMWSAATMLAREPSPLDDWRWLTWGAGAGLAALIRGETVALGVLPALALGAGTGWRRLRIVVLTGVGTAIALGPWTFRNARVFGAFVPISTSFGRTFFIGHNDAADGGWNPTTNRLMTEEQVRLGSNRDPQAELTADRAFRRYALDFIASHSAAEGPLTLQRIYRLFRSDDEWAAVDGGVARLVHGGTVEQSLIHVGNGYYMIVLLLAVVGFLRWSAPRRSTAPRRLVQGAIVYWVAVFAAIYGCPRFHFALIPAFCVLAGDVVAIASGAEPVRYRRLRDLAGTCQKGPAVDTAVSSIGRESRD